MTAATTGLLAAANCLALDVLAARTSDLLFIAGIPSLLLKGPVTALRLYPDDPGRRAYTDVDLLVRVDRFDEAQEVLRRSNYRWLLAGVRSGEFPWHETAWRAPAPNQLAIDLHRGFAGVPNSAAFFDCLWATHTTFQLAGSEVAIPGVSGTALIIALHAASPGRGRKPLIDIRRARQEFDRSTWAEAAEMAVLCGAESSCRAGLTLLPGGEEFADHLRIGGTVAADQWLAGRQRDRVSVNLAITLGIPGRRAQLSHLVRKLLPSPAMLRLQHVSARTGSVGLIIVYLCRLGQAAGKGPRAVADVLVARRSIRAAPSHRIEQSGFFVAGLLKSSAAVTAGARRRYRRPLGQWSTMVGRCRGSDWSAIRSALWALRTLAQLRAQLRRGGLDTVFLPAPAGRRNRDRQAVLTVIRLRKATCLERSLLIQRFDAAAGRPRDLIIAVTAPKSGFRAHAWLAGEPQPDGTLQEIVRRPAP